MNAWIRNASAIAIATVTTSSTNPPNADLRFFAVLAMSVGRAHAVSRPGATARAAPGRTRQRLLVGGRRLLAGLGSGRFLIGGGKRLGALRLCGALLQSALGERLDRAVGVDG